MTKALNRHSFIAFYLIGGLLVAGHLCIWFLSEGFHYGRDPWESPTWAYIGLSVAMGLALAALIKWIPSIADHRRQLAFVFAIGLALRLAMLPSTPVLEDDWHRYLWDGAAVANGIDPYAYSPAQAAPMDAFGEAAEAVDNPDLMALRALAEEQRELHYRINYPYVKTIYPPITQAAFGLAHLMAPFSLTAWRVTLLVIDLISFALCVVALRAFGRSSLWSVFYWWNPIVTLEVFNSGHMDGVIVPFLFATLWAAKKQRLALAATALAGAAAVKIWPVLLAPALLRPVLNRPRKLFMLAALFSLVSLALLAPQWVHLADPDQGLTVYSASWRRHAFLYSVLVDGILAGMTDPTGIARYIVAGLTGALALGFALRSPSDGSGMAGAMAASIAALIFLSPTGYPWYLVWLAPFLPFLPMTGFLALIAAGPIYYIRFLLGDSAPLYQWGFVPLAFGIPLALLGLEVYRSRSVGTAKIGEPHV